MNNLILTICSNRKRGNDKAQKYDVNARKIIDVLPDDKRRILNHYRNWAFKHITKRNREWKYLHTIPLNRKLKLGPDIFPGNQEDGAIYMPALERYTGRFYGEFRSAVDDIEACMKRLSGNSENHLLIVSGLYGLLTPTELIQEYNCNIPEERAIKRFWKDSEFLTDLVVAYARKYDINRVFDFMAEDSYRHLIDWQQIEEKAECKIFYSYSGSLRESEQIGVNLLPRLGHAAGLLLREKSELKLSDIRSGRMVGLSGIKLKSDAPQWIPAGTSLSKQEMYAVWSIRMESNIGSFLDEEGIRRRAKWTLKERIDDFKEKRKKHSGNEIGNSMHKIRMFRNDLVHKQDYGFGDEDIKKCRENYKKIADWAHIKGYPEMEDVDY